MILVYCRHITERHRFIFGFILEDILGMNCNFTSDVQEFLNYSGIRFSYGPEPAGIGLHFGSHGILDETGVREQDTAAFRWEGLPMFFPVGHPSALPFDPYAIAFYLVTRYEEYLPFKADGHGRFPATASIAHREGFLDLPLVDILAEQVKILIRIHFPKAQFPLRPFRFIPTFDIDIAFAHLGKGFPRAAAAWVKLLITLQLGEISERIKTISGKMTDPYDNFAWQQEITALYGLGPKYFVLLGDFGEFDRNTSFRNRRFQKLIHCLSKYADLGLHPSYKSYMKVDLFMKEKTRLEEIIGKPVNSSRFHFLRLKFPESFRILDKAGITNDYSMGYSNFNGFRASTCTPFYFYDLGKEEKTDLLLHPFIFMDSAMIDHLDYSPGQAVSEAGKLVRRVTESGGEAIGIWHNYALSDKNQYAGWKKAFEMILKETGSPSL
jgi:hypothetical protein